MRPIEPPADIVSGTPDVALADHWFPLERYRGQSFRWVENDAVIHVAALEPLHHTLRLVVEPGPGVGLTAFDLSVRASDGSTVEHVTVRSKQVVKIVLPPERPRVFTLVLHAESGGKVTANDPRILNFRVFEVEVERYADVFPSWATPGKGFYVLETFAGAVFRWVGNDGVIGLHPSHGDTLIFDVESGPGQESKTFALHVRRADGSDVTTAEVSSRTRVRVPLEPGVGDTLILHSDGGGKTSKGDPRVMNFRVFAAT